MRFVLGSLVVGMVGMVGIAGVLQAGEPAALPPPPPPPPPPLIAQPATVPAPTLEANLRRLKLGYFPLSMQRSGGNLALMKESNIDSRLCTVPPTADLIATFQKEGLPIFLYVFDEEGALYSSKVWTENRAAFVQERTPAHLQRSPSLFDPAVRQALKDRVAQFAEGYKGCDVLAACVAHEASITSFSSPLDFDYSEPALKAFRGWLKTRYASIEELNTTWGLTFADFDSVLPPQTEAMIDREMAHYPAMNLAPWCDFRQFMDDSYIDLIHELAAVVRAKAPAMPVAVTVTAVPSAYGGWDYGRLLQAGKIDVIETYPFPGDKGLIAGLSAGVVVNASSFSSENGAGLCRAWHHFLLGDRATAFEGKSSKIFPEKNKLGGLSALYKPDFDAMRAAAKIIGEASIDDGGVRMIYSQPSVRCSWFIDIKQDGKTYINRGSAYEIDHSTYIQTLGGWQALLGELAIHPLFESNLDLQAGRFRHGVPKVLIANQYLCVSDAELAFLKHYVEGGGLLIVDDGFALFDGHGNARKDPQIPLANQPRGKLRAFDARVQIPNEDTVAFTRTALGPAGGAVITLRASVVRYGDTPASKAQAALQGQVAEWVRAKMVVLEGDTRAHQVDVVRYSQAAQAAQPGAVGSGTPGIPVPSVSTAGKTWLGVCSTRPDEERTLQIGFLRAHETPSADKGETAEPVTVHLEKNRGVVVELK